MLYPLRFEPIFRRYIWGGHRLAKVLNKSIGDESCAESWEVVDHNQDQSVVAFGPLAKQTLAKLIEEQGRALLGAGVMKRITDNGIPDKLQNRFPLLLKFLDANRSLSVQVHPDDEYGSKLDPPDLGKTEAWYVMDAADDAKIYAGLKPGVTREQFASAVENNTTDEVLHSFKPEPGDCVFIKAGTMHAIGAGILIAEIQQCSDTTFRLFDWNRVDKDGQPRPLHIEQGIKATDFELGPVAPVRKPRPELNSSSTLVDCDKFVLRRWNCDQPITLGGDDRFRIIAVTNGAIEVENDPCEEALGLGKTMLLPASCGKTTFTPKTQTDFLEIYVPD